MKTYEVDVELRVRKTLRMRGFRDEAHARAAVEGVLSGDFDICHRQAWSDSRNVTRPVPVEQNIAGDDIWVHAVREVPE